AIRMGGGPEGRSPSDLLLLGGGREERAVRRATTVGRGTKSPSEELDELVSPGHRFAEPAHRIGGQTAIDLVEPQVDLAVGERAGAPAPTVDSDAEGDTTLDLEHPQGLRDPELLQPVHVDHAPDRASVARAEPVADGGEIDGAVRHEVLAVGRLCEPRLAD